MSPRKIIYVVDLFCGAGGISTGLRWACEKMGLTPKLLAINHNPIAVETHAKNHPDAVHICQSLSTIDPFKVVTRRTLDLLIAAPECTHFSGAAGGVPRSEQSRATPFQVLDWVAKLRPRAVVIENVRELMTWGKLGPDQKPDKKHAGELFQTFIQALHALGYNVEYRVLNCANFGDPTTRQRLFILARRGRLHVEWPRQTHSEQGDPLLGLTEKWRPVGDIMQWNLLGQSVFDRRKPLCDNTMARIAAGLERFGGGEFILGAGGPEYAGKPRSIERPLNTVLTENHAALAQAFVLNVRGGDDGYLRGVPITYPCPAVTTHPPLALVEGFIVPVTHGKGDVRYYSLDRPLPTITSKNAWGLMQMFLRNPRAMPRDGDLALDLRFRMLTERELARAMSFPDNYQFVGRTQEIRVRQIGNAIPVRTAEALCTAALN